MSLRRVVAGALSASVLVSALNFVTTAILARLCGPSAVGGFVEVFALAQLAFAFMSPGFDQAVIRAADGPRVWRAALVLTGIQIVALLTLPAAVVLFAKSLLPIGDGFTIGILEFELIMATIASSVASNLMFAPSASQLRYRAINGSRICGSIAGGVAGVCCAASVGAGSPLPFFLREVVYALTVLVVALRVSQPIMDCGWPARCDMRDVWLYARSLMGLNCLERLVQRSEIVVLRHFVETSELGVYFAIRSIFDGVAGVAVAQVQTVGFAVLCRQGHRWHGGRLLSLRRALSLIVLFVLGAWLVSWCDTLFPLVFGEKYRAPPWLAGMFFATANLVVAFEIAKVAMMARGCHGKLLVPRVLQLLVFGIASVALGGGYGCRGIALSVVLGNSVLCLASWVVVRALRER